MKAVLLLGCLSIAFANPVWDLLLKYEFETYKLTHNKSYDGMENLFRKKIYIQNRKTIAEHNMRYKKGLETYEMGINQFTDLLESEFNSMMNGLRVPSDLSKMNTTTFLAPANLVAPSEMDWRGLGAVTAVKDQGNCGSCWAFASTGALEGQHFRKNKVLEILSEQNLVDCSTNDGNQGCNGGWMSNAYKYIRDNKGIDRESAYRYEARQENCRFNRDQVAAIDYGSTSVPEDENSLLEAVASQGPIAVGIDASHGFQHYSNGVFYNSECYGDINHAVLVVGYGRDASQGDYWLVKNSWSSGWGEQGYIRMARNRNNNCHIASYGVFPNV